MSQSLPLVKSSKENFPTMSESKAETITCKAAVAWEAGKPLSIEEVEVGPPRKGECLTLPSDLRLSGT